MTINAKFKQSTGRVIGWGHCDFASELKPGEAQSVVDSPPPPGTPLHYLKVVGGQFATMTAPERVAADAEVDAESVATLVGELEIRRVLPNAAALPLPPPRARLLVGLVDGGAGVPAIAISTANRWGIIDVDRVIGP